MFRKIILSFLISTSIFSVSYAQENLDAIEETHGRMIEILEELTE